MVKVMKAHEILNALYRRSGYTSYKTLARDMGLADGSSVQRYFKEGWSKRKQFFPPELVAGFEDVFVGKGHPPITKEEVWKMGSPLPVNIPQDRLSVTTFDYSSVGKLWDLYKGAPDDIKEEFDTLHDAYQKKKSPNGGAPKPSKPLRKAG